MIDKTIYVLIDYKGNFESKHNARPYRSGMNKNLINQYFTKSGYNTVFIELSEVINYSAIFWDNKFVIYTSSEDIGYFYKSYIEDIIYYLELCKAKVIPSFKYLRANNNKVFMELLRNSICDEESNIKSKVFGCYEEIEKNKNKLVFPLVYKQSEGAMSKGVGLINKSDELSYKIKNISESSNVFKELRELLRTKKHKGYIKESRYRKKFIIQNFIPNLDCDYKILVFSDKFYVLKRGMKKDDFKASGSGIRNFVKELPEGLLDFAHQFYQKLNVPNASIDIAFNGFSFFIIEFQCLYFGSFTLSYSKYFWQLTDNKFEMIEKESELEKVYVQSVVKFITVI